MANKVKFGLKSAAYAVATFATDGTVSYGTPVMLPGSVSLSLDPQGDTENFYADNIVYYTSQSNNGYQGDYECAMLPDSFRTDVLREITDQNGLKVEVVNPDTVHFAFLFQVEGDQNAVRHVLYNCTASRPSVGSTTTEETTTPQTDTIQITSHPVEFSTLADPVTKAKVDASVTTVYNSWFTAVQTPGAPAA